jgi:hypothetical protein
MLGKNGIGLGVVNAACEGVCPHSLHVAQLSRDCAVLGLVLAVLPAPTALNLLTVPPAAVSPEHLRISYQWVFTWEVNESID